MEDGGSAVFFAEFPAEFLLNSLQIKSQAEIDEF